MIIVVHIRDASPDAVYIGPPCEGRAGSPLMPMDGHVSSYRHWLWRELQRGVNRPASIELRRLLALWQANGSLELACWCAPKECHGDVVKAAIEWIAK